MQQGTCRTRLQILYPAGGRFGSCDARFRLLPLAFGESSLIIIKGPICLR